MTISIAAPAEYQHKGYSISLDMTPNGVKATCSNDDQFLIFNERPTRAESLYLAMRTIDAQAISLEIDAAIDRAIDVAGDDRDAAIDQVTELVHQLVKMISNG